MQRQQGFSMVEVLVSIVILSIGLLGTAGLMSASLKNTNTSYYRSQATVLADDILDRMRANITAARDSGHYNIGDGPAYSAPAGNNIARFDCEEWIATIEATLPDGAGEVSVDAGDVATIIISWGTTGDADEPRESFTTISRL